MNADDLLNRLLYAFTALALIWAFATSETSSPTWRWSATPFARRSSAAAPPRAPRWR